MSNPRFNPLGQNHNRDGEVFESRGAYGGKACADNVEDTLRGMMDSLPEIPFSKEWQQQLRAKVREKLCEDRHGDEVSHSVEIKHQQPRGVAQRRLRQLALASIASMLVGGVLFAGQPLLRSLFWYRQQPALIELSRDGNRAYLIAEDNSLLHLWSEPGIESALLFPRTADATMEQLAILGFSAKLGNQRQGRLVAFDVNGDYDRPIWEVGIADDEIPMDLLVYPDREYHGRHFSPRWTAAADVFPENQGLEVIGLFQHGPFSQCSIRIYGAKGELLFQCWHDGNISDCLWLSEPKMLVCLGVNAEVDATDRGFADAIYFHPTVLFAVRPVLGATSPLWIDTVDHDGGINPEWYKCLLDLPATNWVREAHLRRAHPQHDRMTTFEVTLEVETPIGRVALGMHLDSAGNEIVSGRVLSDGYRRALQFEETPSPDDFSWGELPPIHSVHPGMWIPGEAQSKVSMSALESNE